MNALQTRKQLLIAESETNRSQLIAELEVLTTDVRQLAGRARSYGALVSSVAVLITGLVAIQRGRSGIGAAKTGWRQTLFKGAGLVSSLWLAFRARPRNPVKSSAEDERQNHVAQH